MDEPDMQFGPVQARLEEIRRQLGRGAGPGEVAGVEECLLGGWVPFDFVRM